GAAAERGSHLHVGEDHPLPGGQAGLGGADALRRVLPLVAPLARRAAQDVIEQTLVVLLLGIGMEGRELLGARPCLRRQAQGGGGEPDREAARAHPARPAAARVSFASASLTRSTNARARRVISSNRPAAASAGSASAAPRPTPTQPACRNGTVFSRFVPP